MTTVRFGGTCNIAVGMCDSADGVLGLYLESLDDSELYKIGDVQEVPVGPLSLELVKVVLEFVKADSVRVVIEELEKVEEELRERERTSV